MVFSQKQKEGKEGDGKYQHTLNNQMRQLHIEQFRKEFKDKVHTDYKESLQNLLTELVSEDLKQNARK